MFNLTLVYVLFIIEERGEATWPSGKAGACKALIPQFESGCRLFKFSIFEPLEFSVDVESYDEKVFINYVVDFDYNL